MKYFVLLVTLLLTTVAGAQQPDPALLRDKEVVATFRSLPVQEGGRVKPLDTYARFMLLRLTGHQKLDVEHASLPGVKKLQPIEWLLLSWFRPDIARDLPLFVVDNSQAVGEIGVDPKGLRDRYSYNEIIKGRDELVKRAESYSEIKAEERTGVQRNVIDLARNFFDYDAVSDFMLSARTDWKKEITAILPADFAAEFATAGSPTVWDISEKLGAMIREQRLQTKGEEISNKLLNLFISTTLRPGKTLAFLPPDDVANKTWLNINDVITNYMRDGKLPEGELRRAKAKDALLAASAQPDTFKTAAKAFVTDIRDQAQKRGELVHVDREVRYYQRDYFTNALVLYLLGFFMALLGLMAPRSKFARVTSWVAWLALIAALGCNTWGIVERCIINERPPVATLYETIIFIFGVTALVSLLLEFVLKNSIGLAICGFLGANGMLLSYLYMNLDKVDTMPTLEAVLITNYWLATHVVCINIGYAGSLLASIISMVYLVYRIFTSKDDAAAVEVRRLLSRVVYGTVCFGLLFSLVGTVLGGIWANDSWGRFWGWDPKENGALMIVLMGLIILHARLGGYIREIGLHVLSIVLGAVTLFSWFGVNQLNIGLHSYGFTEGIWLALNSAWAVQALFILLAGLFWWRERQARSAKAAA
jgi:ABC-type transport system involved in cytochrome c biogenesis permease subunit